MWILNDLILKPGAVYRSQEQTRKGGGGSPASSFNTPAQVAQQHRCLCLWPPSKTYTETVPCTPNKPQTTDYAPRFSRKLLSQRPCSFPRHLYVGSSKILTKMPERLTQLHHQASLHYSFAAILNTTMYLPLLLALHKPHLTSFQLHITKVKQVPGHKHLHN